jgi:hypothetical protein
MSGASVAGAAAPQAAVKSKMSNMLMFRALCLVNIFFSLMGLKGRRQSEHWDGVPVARRICC